MRGSLSPGTRVRSDSLVMGLSAAGRSSVIQNLFPNEGLLSTAAPTSVGERDLSRVCKSSRLSAKAKTGGDNEAADGDEVKVLLSYPLSIPIF